MCFSYIPDKEKSGRGDHHYLIDNYRGLKRKRSMEDDLYDTRTPKRRINSKTWRLLTPDEDEISGLSINILSIQPTSPVTASSENVNTSTSSLNMEPTSPTTTSSGENSITIHDIDTLSTQALTPTRASSDIESDVSSASTEDSLRKIAIHWMKTTYAHLPNGTCISPPYWYQTEPVHRRPVIWMKDWITGHIRPLELRDEMINNWTEKRRQEWITQQLDIAYGDDGDLEEREDVSVDDTCSEDEPSADDGEDVVDETVYGDTDDDSEWDTKHVGGTDSESN
jgi:hypothetical protein